MARGRMLSKSLSTSRKFRALLDKAGKRREFDQILFALLVAHADDFGRLEGDSFTIKALCYPSSPRPESDFAEALHAMHEAGLIVLYENDGNRYVQVVKFDEHQAGLHKRTRSRFPEPPAISGKFPEIPSELNRTEQNLHTVAPPSATPRCDSSSERKSGNGSACSFEKFWDRFPGRAGRKRDRGEAERQWAKLSAEDHAAALADVAGRVESDEQWRRGFPPDAQRYLRKRAWLNDEPADTEPPYTPA